MEGLSAWLELSARPKGARGGRAAGFTMVEIMAVVAIVAALAALLLPTFLVAKKKATGVRCIANLHEIGIATAAYMLDYDDRYPRIVNYVSRVDKRLYGLGRHLEDDPWDFPTPVEALRPYAGDDRLFLCPLDAGAALGPRFRSFPHLYSGNGGASYLFAELFDGQTPEGWKDPAKAIWACDGSPSWHSLNYNKHDFGTYWVVAVHQDGHTAVVHANAPTWIE